MLTETVAGRTYNYTHNVGRGAQSGMGFNWPVAMTFTPDGQVCLSNNPIPPPALEGSALEIICIDPEYDPELEEADLVTAN